ncbi:hypothetical protein ACJJTC_006381 [Scirpophaga incertulas]
MNIRLFLHIVCLISVVYKISALNILGIFPYPGRSHFIVYSVFLQELSRRGHNVTVISHFPEKQPRKNYHDIPLGVVAEKSQDLLPVGERSVLSHLMVALYLTSSGSDNCETLLANEKVRSLVKKEQKFDVIFVELFNNDCGYGLAYKLKAPVVAITSHILMPWHYKRFGIPNNPSYVSYHFLEGGTKPTLYQRITRLIHGTIYNSLYRWIVQRNNQATLAKYYDDIPPLEELGSQAKFVLLYQHYSLTGSILYPANVIEVGGYHVAKPKQLTGDLKQFVEGAESGIIYVSFGSMAKVSDMPQKYLESILGAFQKFPQRFIWRWDDTSMDKPQIAALPKDLKDLLTNKSKLYIANWLPQLDILAHPKTLAFFSHAGMGSTVEAIHFGVPMVAMAIFGDQPANAAAVKESGLGVQIAVNELSKEVVITALQKVLEPTFKAQVKELSKIWHDRPQTPMDTVVYWTEYAARSTNHTFRTAAADVPFYQYIYLDVTCIFVIFLVVNILIIKFFLFLCRRSNKQMNVKSSNKKQKKK